MHDPQGVAPHEGPPYIGIAVFCEQALEEKDGIFSLVRMFNEVNVTPAPGRPLPTVEQPLPIPLLFFLLLYDADKVGWNRLSINMTDSLGPLPPTRSMSSNPLPDKSHLAVRARMTLPLRSEGIHWAEVVFNGRLLSRVPLNVIVVPADDDQTAIDLDQLDQSNAHSETNSAPDDQSSR